ncbi:MAG: protein kinase [Planctomycetes bacterium]|nr:protein kinase [Planctomycetota bacterium]
MTDTPDPRRDPQFRARSEPAHVSRPADVSLEARASALRFLEQLAARTPETERYSDQGEIARGGMGSIRRVDDQVLRRTLAMKVLLERDADDDPDSASSAEIVLARFLEEAQVTGQLDHPGVVPVHDMGVDEKGRVWFTMRLVQGRNFEEIIALVRRGEEGWTLTRAVQSLLRVCEAMAFAHSKGVVHRDLKPANVMVGRFGETYVMDWGLARVAGASEVVDASVRGHGPDSATLERARRRGALGSGHSPQLTMAGSIVGTPAYMAPEQARGEVEAVDERSDVYAVGSMLYHLLSGHRPYLPPGTKLDALEMLRAVVAGPPARLDANAAPPELVAVCEKAMARGKDARYATMLALAEDLQAYLEGRVVRAHRTGARAEFAKWVGRNKLAAGALAAATVLTLGGLAAIAWITHAKNRQHSVARDAAVMESYGSNLSAASACLTLDAVGEARRRLDACVPELRGWEWEHLSLSAQPSVRRLALGTGKINGIFWRPDGREFVARVEGRDELRDAETGNLLGTLDGEFPERAHLAWSRDGRWLALGGKSGRMRVLERATLREAWSIQAHGCQILSIRFSPDGARIYSSGGESEVTGFGKDPRITAENGRIRAWDARDGSALFVLGGPGKMTGAIALDASGGRLLCADSDATVRLYDTNTHAVLAVRRFQSTIPTLIAFDGGDVLLGSPALGVQRWSADLQSVLATLDATSGLLGLATEWTLGEHLLAGRRSGGPVRIFDRHTFDEVSVLHVGPELSADSAFDPRSGAFATGDQGVITLWNPEITHAAFDLPPSEWTIAATLFVPGREELVSVLTNGEVALLDAETGLAIAKRRTKSGKFRAAAVAADGAHVLLAYELRAHVLALPSLEETAAVAGTWVACAASSTSFLVAAEDGRIAEVAVSGATTERAKHLHGSVTTLACDAEGDRIATGTSEGSVYVHRRDGGATWRAHTPSGDAIVGLDVDATSDWLTAANSAGALLRWSLQRGVLVADPVPIDVPFVTLRRAPGTQRLFSVGSDGLLRVWDHASLRPIATLAQGASVKSLAVGSDGRRVAVELDGGRVRILESRGEDLHSAARTRHVQTERSARARVALLTSEVGALETVERRIREEARSAPEFAAAAAAPLAALRDDVRRLHRHSARVLQQKDESAAAQRAAREQAERVWRLEPERRVHAEALALAYLRTGEPERALEFLTREFASTDERPGVWLVRGLVEARAGRVEAAREALGKAREARRKKGLEKGEDWSELANELEATLRKDAPR